MLKDKPPWCLPLPSICLPLINRHKGRVYDVTHCFILQKKMRSSILTRCLVSVFPHINYVPSSIYIEMDRFTNERLSIETIETIGLPRLARVLLTLIGSCKIYSVFQIKAARFQKRYLSCNRFAKEIVLLSPIFFKTFIQTCKSNRALHLY